jgi:N utilization substance protein B
MFRIKYSREVVLKLLYQVDLLSLDETPEEIIEQNSSFFRGLNEPELQFIKRMISQLTEKREYIDDLISKNLIGWKLQRLNPVDRTLLRMGIAESYFNTEKAIIIDDIVRIAKKYGEEDSFKIINAILDKVL